MSTLPWVLVTPPWTDTAPVEAEAAPPQNVEVLVEDEAVDWEEGERERWLDGHDAPAFVDAERDDAIVDELLERLDKNAKLRTGELARLSDDGMASLLAECGPRSLTLGQLRLVIARLGARAIPDLFRILSVRLPNTAFVPAVLPVRSPRAAVFVATFLTREAQAKSPDYYREHSREENDAERWLSRFPFEAALGLIPAAVDPEHRDHAAALSALRYVATRGDADAITRATGRYPAEVQAACPELDVFARLSAVRDVPGGSWLPLLCARGDWQNVNALLAPVARPQVAPLMARWLSETQERRQWATEWLTAHPDVAEAALSNAEGDAGRQAKKLLDGDETAADERWRRFPDRIPPLPAFFDPAALPAPELTDGDAIDQSAVVHLGTMMRFSPLATPYIGVEAVRDACTPDSLDRFAHALLLSWIDDGEEPTGRWTVLCAGQIGGERCAQELAKYVRTWAHRVSKGEQRARAEANARSACAALAAIGSDIALMHLDSLARRSNQSWLRREAQSVLADAGRLGAAARSALADELVPDFGLDADGSLVLDFGPRTFVVGFDEHLVPFATGDDGRRLKSFPRKRKTDDETKVAEAKQRFDALRRDVKALASQQLARLEAAMATGRRLKSDVFVERFVRHPLMMHVARRLLWASPAERGYAIVFRVAEDGTFADAEEEAVATPDGDVVLVHPVWLDEATVVRWREVFDDYQLVQPFAQLEREHFRLDPKDLGRRTLRIGEGDRVPARRFFGLRHRGWDGRSDGGAIMRFEAMLAGDILATIHLETPFESGLGSDAPDVTIERIECASELDRLTPIAYSELYRDAHYLCRPT